MRRPNFVGFKEWAPDRGTIGGGDGEAKGVYSIAGGYAPLLSLGSYGTDARLSGACLGARSFFSRDGQAVTFAADATKVYRLVNRVFLDVSKAGGYTASGPWTFEQFGDYIFAANRGVPKLQYYQIGVSDYFADVPGVPPIDTVFRVKYQLVGGYDRTLSWSAFNNALGWDFADTATQAGTAEVDQLYGSIMCGVGGEVGYIFQERAVSRLTYVGPSTIWQRDDVETGRGAISKRAVSKFGRLALYVSEDGFWAFDGLQSTPIGDKKVDDYFVRRLNYPARDAICTVFNPSKRVWMVAFPTGSSTVANEILMYSASDGRWSRDEITVQHLMEMPNEALTFDSTDLLIARYGSASLDAITDPLDSPVWKDDRRQWAAFDTSNRLNIFNGTARAATIETETSEPVPGRRAYVSEVLPQTDAPAANVTATVKSKRNLLANTAHTATADMNDEGVCPVQIEGRYISTSIAIDAGATWSEITGVHYTATEAGDR